MFNSPKVNNKSCMKKPLFRLVVPPGFLPPVFPMRGNKSEKVKTPSCASRDPVITSSCPVSWVNARKKKSRRKTSDPLSPYIPIPEMFENFDAMRNSARREREERLFTYSVLPEVLKAAEDENSSGDLLDENEIVDIVRKIDFDDFAFADTTIGPAARLLRSKCGGHC